MGAKIKLTYIPPHHEEWWYTNWKNNHSILATFYWSIKEGISMESWSYNILMFSYND